MAKSCKVELISSGVRELLHEVGSTACKQEADKICSRCGGGYATDTKRFPERTVASVYTDTTDAMVDNKAHNTLKRCLR